MDQFQSIQKVGGWYLKFLSLLILDNHSSHCSLEAIKFCRDNGIVLLSIPPHTSHKLQPLDVGIFGPFKKFCNTSFNDFMVNKPGKGISIFDIAELTRTPFLRAFTPENIIQSFLKTGICPVNTILFEDGDFIVDDVPDEIISESIQNSQDISTLEDAVPMEPSSESGRNNQSIQKCISSNKSNYVTPEQLRPVSNLPPKPVTSRTGKSKIYTSTPEKTDWKKSRHQKRVQKNKS